MHLWNDYEGTVFAGRWKLNHLLRTEGRSALFATIGEDGQPAVLRLTEALNDQAALHARNRAIQAAGDRYLVALESFGDGELDGTPMSYALLEPTQESLADILAARKLDPEEAQEVATCLAGGLHALHAQGLVHGLVEPESVLAAGERIKLRSDCARWAPAPEDIAAEGAITAQTDALGLAGVIYQSLTRNRLHDASDALALPEPFASMVRNAARGVWGVPDMEAELLRYNRAHAPAAPVAPISAGATAATPSHEPAPVPSAAAVNNVPAGGRRATVKIYDSAPVSAPDPGDVPLSSRAATVKTYDTVPLSTPSAGHAPLTGDAPLSSRAATARIFDGESAWQKPERSAGLNTRSIAVAAGAVILLLILFLVFHHAKAPTGPARAVTPQASPALTASSGAVATPALAAGGETGAVTASQPSTTTGDGATAPRPSPTLAPTGKIWRVIAYTYNRRAEAQAKARSLDRRFPKFHAEVWSRTGNAPYLVTLGGAMPQEQAFELRSLARRTGVAPDVYAQNYSR